MEKLNKNEQIEVEKLIDEGGSNNLESRDGSSSLLVVNEIVRLSSAYGDSDSNNQLKYKIMHKLSPLVRNRAKVGFAQKLFLIFFNSRALTTFASVAILAFLLLTFSQQEGDTPQPVQLAQEPSSTNNMGEFRVSVDRQPFVIASKDSPVAIFEKQQAEIKTACNTKISVEGPARLNVGEESIHLIAGSVRVETKTIGYTVTTINAEVRVVGTTFEVIACPHKTRVGVVSGEVKVLHNTTEVFLSEGDTKEFSDIEESKQHQFINPADEE